MWKSCCPGSGSIKGRMDLQSDLSGRALARPAPLAGEQSAGTRQGQRGEKYEKDYFSHISGALDGIYF